MAPDGKIPITEAKFSLYIAIPMFLHQEKFWSWFFHFIFHAVAQFVYRIDRFYTPWPQSFHRKCYEFVIFIDYRLILFLFQFCLHLCCSPSCDFSCCNVRFGKSVDIRRIPLRFFIKILLRISTIISAAQNLVSYDIFKICIKWYL